MRFRRQEGAHTVDYTLSSIKFKIILECMNSIKRVRVQMCYAAIALSLE